jgi:hypothetical protein
MTATAGRTDSLRCGSKLANSGDTRSSVRSKCGDPAEISHQTMWRRPFREFRGRTYYSSDELVEIPVEIWTYNFGPNKLMHRLRFVDGLLEDVETLSYGYNEDR